MVVAAAGVVIVPDAGPDIFDQAQAAMVPSGSLDEFPFSVTVLTGSVMLCATPALATGV